MYFDANNFGHRVKKLREQQGFTQEALATHLNVTFTHISRVECGNRVPSVDIMIELAELFHVSLDYLITGKHYRSDSMKSTLLLISELLKSMAEDL